MLVLIAKSDNQQYRNRASSEHNLSALSRQPRTIILSLLDHQIAQTVGLHNRNHESNLDPRAKQKLQLLNTNLHVKAMKVLLVQSQSGRWRPP